MCILLNIILYPLHFYNRMIYIHIHVFVSASVLRQHRPGALIHIHVFVSAAVLS